MKILLMTSYSDYISLNAPPVGLYRLKKMLNIHGFECDVVDLSFSEKIDSVKKRVLEYQIIGISGTHDNMSEDLSLIMKFRTIHEKSNSKCLFIAGGHEPAQNYKQWLAGGIDIIFLGYAERSLVQLAQKFSKGYEFGMTKLEEIDGIVFHKQKKVHFKASQCMTQAEFEFLTYEQLFKLDLPFTDYWNKLRTNEKGLNFWTSIFIPEMVRLYTSSHCPNKCGYCNAHSFLSFSQQKKSPILALNAEQIIDLVFHFIKKYQAKGFLFSDDEFLSLKSRAMSFSNLVIKLKKDGKLDNNIIFNCLGRINDFITSTNKVDTDFIKKLSGANFRSIGLGVETFSDRLLKVPSMNKKGFSEKIVFEIIKEMLNYNLYPFVFIILFIPEITIEELIHTMECVINLVIKGCQVNINPLMLAWPGSPIYENNNYTKCIQKYRNSFMKEEIDISLYYLPWNDEIAQYASQIEELIQLEIKQFRNKIEWNYEKIPRTIVAILTIIATLKMMGKKEKAKECFELINRLILRSKGKLNNEPICSDSFKI